MNYVANLNYRLAFAPRLLLGQCQAAPCTFSVRNALNLQVSYVYPDDHDYLQKYSQDHYQLMQEIAAHREGRHTHKTQSHLWILKCVPLRFSKSGGFYKDPEIDL